MTFARTMPPLLFAVFTMMPWPAHAQSDVATAGNQHTVLSAVVADQARMDVPSGIRFDVSSVEQATASDPASVRVEGIVLPTPTAQLRVAVRADARSFTPPVASATTWSASDVSWNGGEWRSGVGIAGMLSADAYATVATCDPDVSSCGTDGLVFSLAAKPEVSHAGHHNLSIVSKLEAIDP